MTAVMRLLVSRLEHDLLCLPDAVEAATVILLIKLPFSGYLYRLFEAFFFLKISHQEFVSTYLQPCLVDHYGGLVRADSEGSGKSISAAFFEV